MASSSGLSNRGEEHLQKWNSRQQRDPREIEYERQRDQLTFKPNTMNDRSLSGANRRPRSIRRQPKGPEPEGLRKKSFAKPVTDPRQSQLRRQAEPWVPNAYLAKDQESQKSQTADFRPSATRPRKQASRASRAQQQEPVCVLKVELDGEHTEKIKIFADQDPREIVAQFGEEFNLSDNAMNRLLN
jgi:hypothetical protein